MSADPVVDQAIRDAGRLLSRCAPYMRYEATRGIGRRDTYFAVDADVVVMYLRPFDNHAYGIVFEDGDPHTESLLAGLLGDYLFAPDVGHLLGAQATGTFPQFLVSPSHVAEILNNLSALNIESQTMAESLNWGDARDTITDLFRQARDEQWTKDHLAAALAQNVPDLVHLYGRYEGWRGAVSRFRGLGPDPFLPWASIAPKVPVLDGLHSPADKAILDRLIGFWTVLLKECGRGKRDVNIARDAATLAAVEWANTAPGLDERSPRVVLITGTQYVFDAARLWVPDKEGARAFSTADDGTRVYAVPDAKKQLSYDNSFGSLYLCHPHAFLASEDFFSESRLTNSPAKADDDPQDPSWFRPIEWTYALLSQDIAPDHRPLRPIDKQSRERFEKAIDSVDLAEVGAKWNTLVRGAAVYRYPITAAGARLVDAQELASLIDTLGRETRWTENDLKTTVRTALFGATEDLFKLAGSFGIVTGATQEHSPTVPIHCNEVEQFNDCVKQIIAFQKKKARGSLTDEDMAELRSSFERLGRVDQYYVHLAQSSAFAGEGYWLAALSMARFALDRIPRLSPAELNRKKIDGREASYLACVARRRSARNLTDLEQAWGFLEATRASKSGQGSHLRFDVEEAALRTRGIYFRRFVQHEPLLTDAGLTKIYEDCLSLLPSLEGLIRRIGDGDPQVTNWKPDPDRLRHWALRECLVDGFMISWLTEDLSGGRSSLDRGQAKSWLQLFRGLTIDAESDRFAFLVLQIAVQGYDDDMSARREAEARAKFKYGEALRPYDKPVVRFLLNKAEEFHAEGLRAAPTTTAGSERRTV